MGFHCSPWFFQVVSYSWRLVGAERRLDFGSVGGSIINRFPLFGELAKVSHNAVNPFTLMSQVLLLPSDLLVRLSLFPLLRSPD